MTPKEKAKELHSKLFKIINYNNSTSFGWGFKTAKTCASMLVDEILNLMESVSTISGNYFRGTETHGYVDADIEEKYWQKVKEEIEKMPIIEMKTIP